MVALGPALGFLMGSALLSQWINVGQKVPNNLTTHDPRWIGRWWAGFLVSASMLTILSLLLFTFPRKMIKPDHAQSNHGQQMTTAVQLSSTIETHPSIDINQSSTSVCALGNAATRKHTLPKIKAHPNVKNAFKLSQLKDILTSVRDLLLNFTYLLIVLVNSVESILVVSFTTYMVKYIESVFHLSSSISSILTGAIVIPAAVFGTLFGGWLVRRNHMGIRGCVKLILSHYNCSCVLGHDHHVKSGSCNNPCYLKMIFFMTILFFVTFFQTIGATPQLIIILRSVQHELQSFALGLENMIIKLIAHIPVPIIFGTIIDDTCLFWNRNCDRRGSCFLYNGDRLPLTLFGATMVMKGVSLILLIILLCLTIRIANCQSSSTTPNELSQPSFSPNATNHIESQTATAITEQKKKASSKPRVSNQYPIVSSTRCSICDILLKTQYNRHITNGKPLTDILPCNGLNSKRLTYGECYKKYSSLFRLLSSEQSERDKDTGKNDDSKKALICTKCCKKLQLAHDAHTKFTNVLEYVQHVHRKTKRLNKARKYYSNKTLKNYSIIKKVINNKQENDANDDSGEINIVVEQDKESEENIRTRIEETIVQCYVDNEPDIIIKNEPLIEQQTEPPLIIDETSGTDERHNDYCRRSDQQEHINLQNSGTELQLRETMVWPSGNLQIPMLFPCTYQSSITLPGSNLAHMNKQLYRPLVSNNGSNYQTFQYVATAPPSVRPLTEISVSKNRKDNDKTRQNSFQNKKTKGSYIHPIYSPNANIGGYYRAGLTPSTVYTERPSTSMITSSLGGSGTGMFMPIPSYEQNHSNNKNNNLPKHNSWHLDTDLSANAHRLENNPVYQGFFVNPNGEPKSDSRPSVNQNLIDYGIEISSDGSLSPKSPVLSETLNVVGTRLGRRQYDYVRKLDDQMKLNAYLEESAAEHNCRWTWRRTSANSRGYKVYYVCNFSMRRHYYPCPAAMYALFHPDGFISIYACGEHRHEPKDPLPVSITDETKEEIFKCLHSGMTATEIKDHLNKKSLSFGDARKLNNFIKYHKELLRFGTVTNVRPGGTAYRQPQCWAIRRQHTTLESTVPITPNSSANMSTVNGEIPSPLALTGANDRAI
ncbi:unnamed protein product [Didymodactylos carnosus]|uniref:Uncharacterized protein n=1 Tax=Didymodactylos carnosus TaxID=1234261 RepID=A0A813ZZ69_9BILA|nr:unnamed protein product [Didymodactylos carnosus]CAF3688544.1 unnamed protein product [Didymodactylos carnosus]